MVDLNCARCANSDCGWAGCDDEEICTEYKPRTKDEPHMVRMADFYCANGKEKE